MYVKIVTPAEIKSILSKEVQIHRFPMICYERIDLRISGKTPAQIMDDAKAMAYDANWMVFIHGEKIIGLACVKIYYEKKIAKGMEFEVAVDAKGNGFSNQMLQYIFKFALKNACIYLVLTAFDNSAYSYWKHQGFSDSDTSDDRCKNLFIRIPGSIMA